MAANNTAASASNGRPLSTNGHYAERIKRQQRRDSRFYLFLFAFLLAQGSMYLFWWHSFSNISCDQQSRASDDALEYGNTAQRIRKDRRSQRSEMLERRHSFSIDKPSSTRQRPKSPPKKPQKHHEQVNLMGVEPRAFDPWPENVPFPCVPPDDEWWDPQVQRTPSKRGILFVKEMKTGSSTLAGIAIRIARNVARRIRRERPDFQKGRHRQLCKVRFDHSAAWRLQYGERIKRESFLFTVLRDPVKRITSEFFHFRVSRDKVEPSDENFLQYITTSPHMPNYYLRDLSTSGFNYTLVHRDDVVRVANSVLRDYDFIGITERMHESLVVLQMLLGLETNDMIYVKAKGSGSWDDGAANNGTCVYIVPSFQSPGMGEFFNGNVWKSRMLGDTLLYKAVNVSLDLTIDRLGRQEFEENLARFERAMDVAADSCGDIRFPCTADGKKNWPTDCLWLDSGCGVNCLDKLPATT